MNFKLISHYFNNMKVLLEFSLVLATLILKSNAINHTGFDSFDNFIVNGKQAHSVQFPWQIYIRASSKKKPHVESTCGGVLITTKNALTAAHCCQDYDTFRLAMGLTNLNTIKYVRTVSDCKIHEGYVPSTLQHDIAMFRFRAIAKTSTIKPVDLPIGPERFKSLVSSTAISSGWGYQLNGRSANNLKYITVRIVSNKVCQAMFGKNVFKTTMCAKGNQVESTCRGDSGGPLVFYTKKKKRPILIGITSFGFEDCTKGKPMGFTRVSYYISWIQKYK